MSPMRHLFATAVFVWPVALSASVQVRSLGTSAEHGTVIIGNRLTLLTFRNYLQATHSL
jgi:hypothetical protein